MAVPQEHAKVPVSTVHTIRKTTSRATSLHHVEQVQPFSSSALSNSPA
jgi:hypothetical protein